jgi:hypothetical protein
MSRPMKKPKPEDELCRGWPRCVCNHLWRHWETAIDNMDGSTEEFEVARVMLNTMLECIVWRCPDAKFRSAATLQLLHPVWREDLQCDFS